MRPDTELRGQGQVFCQLSSADVSRVLGTDVQPGCPVPPQHHSGVSAAHLQSTGNICELLLQRGPGGDTSTQSSPVSDECQESTRTESQSILLSTPWIAWTRLAHLGALRMQLIMKPLLQLIRIMTFMHMHANTVLRAGLGRCCRCISIQRALSSLSLHTASTPKFLIFYPGLHFAFRAPLLLPLLDTAVSPACHMAPEHTQPAEHSK